MRTHRTNLLHIAASLLLAHTTAPMASAQADPVTAGGQVHIATSDAGVTLAGTLTVPEGDGPFPGAVLITGSGDHIRDQVISGAPMFRWIAERLTAEGFAVLRIDERGTGGSGGDAWPNQDSTSRLADVRACFEFMQQRPEVDPARIGLLGHSEGAMIAPRLAALDERVAFVVLLATPALSGREIFIMQRSPMREGADEATLRRRRVAYANLIDVSRASPTDEEFRDAVEILFRASGMSDEEIAERLDDEAAHIAEIHRTAFYDEFLSSDAREYLRSLPIPVLAVYGGADHQTPPTVHAPELLKALIAAPTTDYAIVVLPNQDHFFLRQTDHDANDHAYGQMHLSDELLDAVARWLAARFVGGTADHNSPRPGNPEG